MSEHDDANGNGHERERAMRQIKALFQTAGFTEAEIETRTAKAQELLAKYKLVMTDDITPMLRDSDFLTDRAGWIKPLLHSVAKMYFCGYFFEMFPSDWVKAQGLDVNNHKLLAGYNNRFFIRHNFIGKQADITTAKMMGEYLINAMHAMVKEEAKKWPAKERPAFTAAFLNACQMRVSYKIAERMRQTQEGTATGTNLPALRSLYQQAQDDSEAFIAHELKLKMKTSRAMTRLTHAGGARAGHEAGDRLGLDQQVSGRHSGQKRIGN